MNIIIQDNIEPIFELISTLNYICNEDVLSKEIDEYLQDNSLKKQLNWEKDLKTFFKFISKFKEKIKIPKDRLDYFFKTLSAEESRSNNIATIILNYGYIATLNDLTDKINEMTDSELESFICELILRHLDYADESTPESEFTKEFVTNFLIKDTQIQDNGKWLIMILLSKPKSLILELIDIIFSLLEDFNKCFKVFDKDVKNLVIKIKNYIVEDNDFIKTISNIDVEIDEEVLLFPTIINLNSISFRFNNKKIRCFEERYHIHFGWKFKELYDIRHLKADISEQLHSKLKALSDKSKFQIITMLKERPMYGQEIAERLSLTTATVSHHMNSLLSAKLVYINKIENKIYYTVNKEGLQEFVKNLQEKML